ncbi:hypothetical protein PYW07_007793 [Mythimna separata]|uniref:RNA-directed DNA polymerase n=1 Tax=Mythimna separata TaxID=271217 RepID=A0AAD8DV81_MYTSE|nr:hypothetical protein PYW07_007793 [Mythimna separata]
MAINMTDSQFKELLSAITSTSRERSTFAQCPVKFGGSKTEVEPFLAAVTVFKNIEKISDTNALEGMPLVMIGDAAIWWQGVKGHVKTWENFKERLRDTFSPKRLDYELYQDIVCVKQDDQTPTEVFVAKKRALLAEMSEPHTDQQEINLVFGQLRIAVREKINRESIKSFDDLLIKARNIERTLREKEEQNDKTEKNDKTQNNENIQRHKSSKKQNKARCGYCRLPGHAAEVCRRKANDDAEKQNVVKNEPTTNSENDGKPKFSCYGCGEPGVIRSRCPKCKEKQSTTSVDFCFCSANMTADVRPRPTVPITIQGLKGIAYIDTCAKSSVASYRLYKLLEQNGLNFEKEVMYITLADGVARKQDVLTVKTIVNIFGRDIDTSFVIFPDARDNRTLLGVGFIEDAMLALNLPQRTCNFIDEPRKIYELNPESMDNSMDIAGVLSSVCLPKMESPIMNTPSPMITPVKTPVKTPEQVPHLMTPPRSPGSDTIMLGATEKVLERPYGPLIPIGFSTPPKRPRTVLFDGYSPIIDALYEDARRHIDAADVNLSPDSASLFPSTEISSVAICSHECSLTAEEKERLQQFLTENEAVFVSNGKPTTETEHAIDTGSHRPISVPPYRLSPIKLQALKLEIEKMLEQKVIVPCSSPWSAPVVLVPKKDGSTRVCIDYRQLNAITTADKYPLPRIDDLLHSAKPTRYMSTIDLRAGYWQIKVKDEDQLKTAFITPFGMYKFLRMPFGLRNAPATFQRLMDRFSISLSHIKLLVYLDDLIVMSESLDGHYRDLSDVFGRLKEFNLTANKDKCVFFCSKVKYLGHYITPDGFQVDPDRIASIVEMAAPVNVKHLISFLQMCSWYRRFIPNFAKITEPLTRLMKKNAEWTWKDEQQKAFEELRKLLITAPVLMQADHTKPFIIKSDASNYAIGAVLVQGEGKNEHPVEYASRLLTPAERNYSTTEREALAVVWAVNKFRGFIEGTDVTVLTDHQALKWLMTLKSPTGRLARWALQLQPYNLTIKYIKGRTNVVADTLSRPNCDPTMKQDCGVCSIVIDMPRKKSKEIREEQLKDQEIVKIIKDLEGNQHENGRYWSTKGYLMNQGLLYRYKSDNDNENAQLVVPKHEWEKVIAVYHNEASAGHYGVEKTVERIAKRYFWKGMRTQIENYIRNCIECQRYKPSNLKPAGLLQTTALNQRFEVISFDLFGPLPRTAKDETWIFIIEDLASRWVELFALKQATAEECTRVLLDEIILRYGAPRRFISDNGSQFVSNVMQQLTFCLGIDHGFTPVYHPETNPVERRNRDLKTQLAILVGNDHTKWSEHLPSIRFAMNTAVCSSTGYTPAYLTFGRDLRTIDDTSHDLRQIVQNENFIPEITPKLLMMASTLKKAHEVQEMKEEKRKEYADKRRQPCPNYQPGDQVMVDKHALSKSAQGFSAKLAPRRDGPYVIKNIHGPSSFQIADPATPHQSAGLYHSSALRPYQGATTDAPPEPVLPLRRRGRPRKNKPTPSATIKSRPRGRPPKKQQPT